MLELDQALASAPEKVQAQEQISWNLLSQVLAQVLAPVLVQALVSLLLEQDQAPDIQQLCPLL